jgi:hypothetical protein
VSEIEELRIVPARNVVDAKYIRYRTEDRKLREYIELHTDDRKLIIGRKQMGQLFKYLDPKLSEIRNIYSYSDRDTVLFKALQHCNIELSLSAVDSRVIRIVSSDFTAIPHRKVIQLVEQALKGDYKNRKIEYNGGMFAKWTLRSLPSECVQLGNIVSWNLWAYNYNTGSKALRIGGGFTVLRCQNGAVGWKGAAKIRIVHRGDYEELLWRIQEAVDRIINHDLPVMAQQIGKSQKVKAAKEPIAELLRLYPQWIQRKLKERLRRAHTVWEVSNAFSRVATHEPVTWNQRMQLSNHAVEVLRLDDR